MQNIENKSNFEIGFRFVVQHIDKRADGSGNNILIAWFAISVPKQDKKNLIFS